MKRCPSCNRTYTDVSLNFCLEDGTPLIIDSPSIDPHATIRYSSNRDASEPPPTEIYKPEFQPVNQVRPQPHASSWHPGPAPPRKSNAIWWILGAVVLVGIIGVGLVTMIILVASIRSQINENTSNANVRGVNRNANYSNANNKPSNTNIDTSASSLSDDFSEQKWGTGNSRYGEMWYVNGEYHMRSKKETYLVMYAPNGSYQTGNAIVKVTARSVDGTVPSAGFGLIVHGEQSKTKGLQDYALLIYPSDQGEYEVITHKDGNQIALLPKTQSRAIRSGSNPNQLEVRIKGADLSFYINGQYLTRITDSENFRNGLAGFYTSDTTEVAFDDLEIKR